MASNVRIMGHRLKDMERSGCDIFEGTILVEGVRKAV
jgi:hypothetical protein